MLIMHPMQSDYEILQLHSHHIQFVITLLVRYLRLSVLLSWISIRVPMVHDGRSTPTGAPIPICRHGLE